MFVYPPTGCVVRLMSSVPGHKSWSQTINYPRKRSVRNSVSYTWPRLWREPCFLTYTKQRVCITTAKLVPPQKVLISSFIFKYYIDDSIKETHISNQWYYRTYNPSHERVFCSVVYETCYKASRIHPEQYTRDAGQDVTRQILKEGKKNTKSDLNAVYTIRKKTRTTVAKDKPLGCILDFRSKLKQM